MHLLGMVWERVLHMRMADSASPSKSLSGSTVSIPTPMSASHSGSSSKPIRLVPPSHAAGDRWPRSRPHSPHRMAVSVRLRALERR